MNAYKVHEYKFKYFELCDKDYENLSKFVENLSLKLNSSKVYIRSTFQYF